MLNNPKYILEPYGFGRNTRHTCPECGDSNSFTRYVDTQAKVYVSEHVGRCNHENSCGYHYTPKEFFKDGGDFLDAPVIKPKAVIKPVVKQEIPSYVPMRYLRNTLRGDYDANNLVKFLVSLFGSEMTTRIIEDYFLGIYGEDAVWFWQIDQQGKLRTAKLISYPDPLTGKRDKAVHPNWLHRFHKFPNFNLVQCFFGEHLLEQDTSKPVAIVESEKTALIASGYCPEFTWLASGGLSMLNRNYDILQDRRVILFPDVGGYDKWSLKAAQLSDTLDICVSDVLEGQGYPGNTDLADVLIQSNLNSIGL